MRRPAAAAAAIVAAIVVLTPYAAARPSAGDLLRNGNAEAGSAAGDNSSTVPPPDWTTTGAFTAIRYGAAGGFPDASQAAPGGGGAFFAGGPGAPVSTATQVVDISASASAVDADTVSATLTGWLGGWEGQSDDARVSATFLDAGGKALDSTTIGPVTVEDRAGKTAFLRRSAITEVPVHTRSIRVVITSTRDNGVYNDGYADNISLTLGKVAPAATTVTFWFNTSGTARDLPAAPDYVRSEIRGSGSLELAGPARAGSHTAVTSGSGTIRVLHQFALHSERLWLAVKGGGTLTWYENGQLSLRRLVVGVTSSKVPGCPRGRAGFLDLDYGAAVQGDEVVLRLCGRAYVFGFEHGTTRVRIIPK